MNWRRALGLSIMLAGILVGTYWGVSLTAAKEYGTFAVGQGILYGGLFVHLAGVLYVRKE